MTVFYEKEAFFSTEELSQLFQVEQEDIIKLVTEKEIGQQNIMVKCISKKMNLKI
ncbi:MAG: hypothetical protein HC773_17840 [Scytonema sp. CRU_2_7]|nr:hypothetical protein [Scytonema sp. CRU_2_7]